MGAELSDSAPNPLGQAPAVAYPLSAPLFLLGMLLLALCLAVCVDLAWITLASPGDWRPWVGLLTTAGIAGWCWLQSPLTLQGRLSWDGANWWWDAVEAVNAPQRGTIDMRLDTQSGLLIRFAPDTGDCHWLWLGQAADPGRWLALRRAVYADARRRGVDSPPVRATHS